MFHRRRKTPPPYKRVKRHQSAASEKAAAAATVRTIDKSISTSTTKKKTGMNNNSHVQRKTMMLPKQISDHDPKEIILRCAQRMAPYSLSVDTLLRSLRTIRSHPHTQKYHSIDTSSIVFQRSLHAPGVLDFLRAMNFRYASPSSTKQNNSKMLTLFQFDPAAFDAGISALEHIQQTSRAYAKHKALRTFQQEIVTCVLVDATKAVHENELSQRQQYLLKLPHEPSSGGSPITIEFGLPVVTTATNKTVSGGGGTGTSSSIKTDIGSDDNHNNNNKKNKLQKISRVFDHDDTLNDIVNWLGGHIHSSIPKKLRTGEWNIVDRNRLAGSDTDDDFNYYRLDVTALSDKTLYSIGCWPSARIAIVPRVTVPPSPAILIKN